MPQKQKPLQPWRIVSETTVLSSPPYIHIRSQKVELPDGRTVEPYFRIDLRSFAVMCAVTDDQRVVVARQYRHGIGRVSLLLPGGLLERDEAPLDAARRELLEETGYAADHWESLGRFVPNVNYYGGEGHLFLARGARKVAEPNDGDLEETDLLLLPFPDLLEELRNGQVASMSSAAAIALAHARLSGQSADR